MKMQRKVLVVMVSGHLHVEMVEVTAAVRHADGDGPAQVAFEGDLEEIEQKARRQLRQCGPLGPWGDEEPSFEVVTALCASLTGLTRGRIVPVRQVAMEMVKTWASRREEELVEEDRPA